MILLTRLNGEQFMVNDDLIEFIDVTPDTVISMTSGKRIPVAETLDEVRGKIITYKQKIYSGIIFNSINSDEKQSED